MLSWLSGQILLPRWGLIALLAIAGFAGQVLGIFILVLCKVLAEGHDMETEDAYAAHVRQCESCQEEIERDKP